jgi:DNA-binding MarR family transcriptional regulator
MFRDVSQVTPSDTTSLLPQSPLVQQWRDLARHFAQVSCKLDKALHEQHGLGMSDFEILDRLMEGCQDSVRIRMQDLGEAVHLSQSALSRAVARLDKEGLVGREMCDMDRRGVFVCLTEAGRRRWQEASPTHRAVLEESLGAAVPVRA